MANVNVGFGFDNVNDVKSYLREAGVHTGAKLVSIKYEATEAWEAFDIELETANGKIMRERTFSPNAEKVFPKMIYVDGKPTREETKQEAFARSVKEVNQKLFYAALAVVAEADLRSTVVNVKDLKDFVDKINKAITQYGNPDAKVNFAAIWKNSDAKQKSNLILASGKWIEANIEGQPAGIKLSSYAQQNNMIEKYPYKPENGGTPSQEELDEALQGEGATERVSDLPF